MIGATTIREYRQTIEKDGALERRFQAVRIEEPSAEEAVEMEEKNCGETPQARPAARRDSHDEDARPPARRSSHGCVKLDESAVIG